MQKMIGKMARMYPMMILMGFMIVIAAFIIGYFNAQTAAAYFSETKAVRETTLTANELNTAQPGSALLQQLGVVSSFASWLNPLRMFGMAFLFTGITIALTVIIGTLRKQAGMLVKFYQQAS